MVDVQQATADLIEHRELYIHKKGVEGAAIGIKTKKGAATGEIAIVVFVSEKLLAEQLTPDERIPAVLGRTITDVVAKKEVPVNLEALGTTFEKLRNAGEDIKEGDTSHIPDKTKPRPTIAKRSDTSAAVGSPNVVQDPFALNNPVWSGCAIAPQSDSANQGTLSMIMTLPGPTYKGDYLLTVGHCINKNASNTMVQPPGSKAAGNPLGNCVWSVQNSKNDPAKKITYLQDWSITPVPPKATRNWADNIPDGKGGWIDLAGFEDPTPGMKVFLFGAKSEFQSSAIKYINYVQGSGPQKGWIAMNSILLDATLTVGGDSGAAIVNKATNNAVGIIGGQESDPAGSYGLNIMAINPN